MKLALFLCWCTQNQIIEGARTIHPIRIRSESEWNNYLSFCDPAYTDICICLSTHGHWPNMASDECHMTIKEEKKGSPHESETAYDV